MTQEKKYQSTQSIAQEKALQEMAEIEEKNGPKGAEPTRYGDWDVDGRLSDF